MRGVAVPLIDGSGNDISVLDRMVIKYTHEYADNMSMYSVPSGSHTLRQKSVMETTRE